MIDYDRERGSSDSSDTEEEIKGESDKPRTGEGTSSDHDRDIKTG